MTKVILFGGGDAGGIIISDTGVRPIPPFDPAILLQLRGIGAIMQSLERIPSENMMRKVGPYVHQLSNLAIEQVEQIVGPLQGEHSLIYQDENGGFSCGATGKPPVAFGWPPSSMPQMQDLIANGVVDFNLIEFFRAAENNGIDILEAFENSEMVSQKLGITLSKQTHQDLKFLAPSQVNNIKDPVDQEIIQYLHKVLRDGRFLQTWATQPFEVSKQLGIKLSDLARDRLIAGGKSPAFLRSGRPETMFVPIAIAIIIILAPSDAELKAVRDRSNLRKF